MQSIAERHEEPTAIRTNLGAIFVSLELSRSIWLITSVSPGSGEKMSRRPRRSSVADIGNAVISAIDAKAVQMIVIPPHEDLDYPRCSSAIDSSSASLTFPAVPNPRAPRLCHVNLNWPREVSTTQFEFMRLSPLATSGKLLLGRRGACGGM